jgi:hypothetical protein
MTRKDYKLIAAAILSARSDIRNKEPEDSQTDLLDGVSYAIDWITVALAQDNPRFDPVKFLKACSE